MLPSSAPLETGDPTWYLLGDLVGTWLSAIGTIAATVVAVWLGLNAVRGERERREAQERAQADQVTLVRRRSPGVTYLTLRNESDLSISAVRAVAEGVANNGLEYVDLLQPGKDRDFFMSRIGDSFTVCAAEFDDAAGRTWIRTADGALHRTHRLGGTALRLNLTRDSGAQIVNKIGMYPGPGPGRRAVWLSVKSLSEQPCVTTWRDTPRRRLPR